MLRKLKIKRPQTIMTTVHDEIINHVGSGELSVTSRDVRDVKIEILASASSFSIFVNDEEVGTFMHPSEERLKLYAKAVLNHELDKLVPIDMGREELETFANMILEKGLLKSGILDRCNDNRNYYIINLSTTL